MPIETSPSLPRSRARRRGRRIGAALVGIFAFGAGCGEATLARPNVLLITVDTLRADHLGADFREAPSRSWTPNLDALARVGTLYENAMAPMPLTLPSHFSILTSRYPREHGVLNNALALGEAETTLPEILGAAGYRTGAFVSVSLLDAASGAAQGFQAFEAPVDSRQRGGAETVSITLAWLATLDADDPFFAWVHLFDPHLPYAPPPAFRDAAAPLAQELPEVDWPDFYAIARRNGGDIPRAVLDHARALYRGEVAYTDKTIGDLLEGLEAQGRRSGTIIVVTADHGESFENGVYFEHADSLYDGAIRIPLIVVWPPAFEPGARIATPVTSLDIAPTLLSVLGLEIPPNYSGIPLQEAATLEDRYVLIQHPFYQPVRARNRPRRQAVIRSVAGDPLSEILVGEERVGIVGQSWKLVRSRGVSALYDRASGERVDLAADDDSLRNELDAILDRELEARPLRITDPTEINDQLLETLRALGYVE
jgi:arylsulfatase A-like enzyme